MKIKEFRELSNDELGLRRTELKEEMFNLRVQQESGQLENPARIRLVRRAIARIETILAQQPLWPYPYESEKCASVCSTATPAKVQRLLTPRC